MKERSDSEDSQSQHEHVTDLLETNRGLLNRKKAQLEMKLQRYEQRTAKIQALLANAEPGDVGYLTNCLQSILAKKQRCIRRANEIKHIQEEMDSFKESVGNLETRPRETDLISNEQRDSTDFNQRPTLLQQHPSNSSTAYQAEQVEAMLVTRQDLLAQLKSLQVTSQKLTQEINQKDRYLDELEHNIEEQQLQLKKLKQSHRKNSQKIVQEEVRIKSLEREVARLEALAQTNAKESERTLNNHAKHKHELQSIEKRHGELSGEVARLERQKQHTERQLQQSESRLKAVCSKIEEFEESLRKSKSQESQQLEKAKCLDKRCAQLTADYDKQLERVAKLKEEEVATLAQLEQLQEQLEKETLLNDKLIQEDRELQKIIDEKYSELESKLKQIQQTEASLHEYTQHKQEMLSEFESIERQKEKLFAAVMEKEQHCKQLEQRKVALEERLSKQEQEAHRYQRLFTDYNGKIEQLTGTIAEMCQRQKQLNGLLTTLQEDETELLSRINELQRTYTKSCLVASLNGHGDGKLDPRVRQRVEQVAARLDALTSTEKALQQERQSNRRLRVELENLKALHA